MSLWGEPFKRGAGIMARGRWGENSAESPGRETGLGECARRSLRWGGEAGAFVSFVGLEPMLNRIALSARLSPTLLC